MGPDNITSAGCHCRNTLRFSLCYEPCFAADDLCVCVWWRWWWLLTLIVYILLCLMIPRVVFVYFWFSLHFLYTLFFPTYTHWVLECSSHGVYPVCVVWVCGVSGDWSSDFIYLLKEVSESFLIFSKSYDISHTWKHASLWKILRHVSSFQTLDFNKCPVWRIFKEMLTLFQKVASTFFLTINRNINIFIS